MMNTQKRKTNRTNFSHTPAQLRKWKLAADAVGIGGDKVHEWIRRVLDSAADQALAGKERGEDPDGS